MPSISRPANDTHHSTLILGDGSHGACAMESLVPIMDPVLSLQTSINDSGLRLLGGRSSSQGQHQNLESIP